MVYTHSAQYIWTDTSGLGYNRYVLFRFRLVLGAAPAAGLLHLFADTRYRLLVNGQVLGHGPARFLPPQPEYDTYDLLPYLHSGDNVIAVVVNSYGTPTFHTACNPGGLIAWGQITDVDGHEYPLATDNSWKAMNSPAHAADTVCLSFALNPAERYDARALAADWAEAAFNDDDWPSAVVLENQQPLGPLAPRSIPLLDERERLPVKRIGTWQARYAHDEDRYSCVLACPEGLEHGERTAAMAFSYIYSPRAQQITMGLWYGDYWMNGTKLMLTTNPHLGMRQEACVCLQEGWNALCILGSLNGPVWELYLGLPREAGLTLSAEREFASAHTFLLGGPWRDAQLRLMHERNILPLCSADGLPAELGPWQPWRRGQGAESPLFEYDWRRLSRLPDDAALVVDGAAYPAVSGDDALVLQYDFGGEVLGRPTLHFHAAAGTTVDLLYIERFTPEQQVETITHGWIKLAERYIAAEGEQCWQTMHPRGMRYLQVVVQGALPAFQLHNISLTAALYPVEPIGSFRCADPVLNAVWALGRDTQAACMEDAYLDCPGRERGLYSGDMLVQFHTNLAAFGDRALMRRCLGLFFASQDASGMLAPCAHGLPPGRHPDYTAVIVHALWRYYELTGDAACVRALAPQLEALLLGLSTLEVAGAPLIDGDALHPYIDLSAGDYHGVNCALNSFYYAAYADAARLLALCGDTATAAKYSGKAADIATAIRDAFWDTSRQCFRDRRQVDVPESAPSVPANALPLFFDIALPEQQAGTLAYLGEALVHNFRRMPPEGHEDCNVSPYFSYFALGAMFRYSKADEALQFIRDCWGAMVEQGAWCTWEYFVDNASRCHAWSSTPTYYLSSAVLGITFPETGNPDRVCIAPQPGTLNWASGVYPHPRGPIHVSWTRKAGKVCVEYRAPEGVEVSVRAK